MSDEESVTRLSGNEDLDEEEEMRRNIERDEDEGGDDDQEEDEDEDEDKGGDDIEDEGEIDTTKQHKREERQRVMINAYKDGLREVPRQATWESIDDQIKVMKILHNVKFVKEGKALGSFIRPDFTKEGCWQSILWNRMPAFRDLSDRKKCIKWNTYVTAIRKKFTDYKTNLASKQKKAFINYVRAKEMLRDAPTQRGRNQTSTNKKVLKVKKDSELGNIVTKVLKAHKAPQEYEVEKFRETLDNKSWKLCVELFLCHAIDKVKYNKVKGEKMLSEYMTVYDEAFALLSLESNYKAWTNEVEESDKAERNKQRLYVRAGKQTKGNFTKMGWTLKGRERYNEICRELIQQRESENSRKKEATFKKEFEENDGSRKKRARTDEEMKWEEEKKKIRAFHAMSAYD